MTEEIDLTTTTEAGNLESKELKKLTQHNFGQHAERFIRSTVTKALLPAETRYGKGRCLEVVDSEGTVYGQITIISSKKVDVRNLQTGDCQAAGWVQPVAAVSAWASEYDGDAYAEWASANVLHPTRIGKDFREFLASRPDDVYTAKLYEVEFTPVQRRRKQGG